MYKNIMVPLDGSELAECVLPHVEVFMKAALAETVFFVRVVEPLPLIIYGESVESFPAAAYGESFADKMEYWHTVEEEMRQSAAEYLDTATSHLKQYGIPIQCEVLMGKTADTLIAYVGKNNINLILIATHGRSGVSRWIMGSVAGRMLRSSRIPVLMVHAPGFAPRKND